MERLDCPEMRRLERFRDYLALLARLQLTGQALGRIDLADVVRGTLVEAYERRGQFHDRTDSGQAAWLRWILARNLADVLSAEDVLKRDLPLEMSLELDLDQASARLEEGSFL